MAVLNPPQKIFTGDVKAARVAAGIAAKVIASIALAVAT
jgi:hypothetical protein